MSLQSSANRRMSQLKKFSIELKQSTQDPNFASNQLLYNIFKLGKQIASPPNLSPPQQNPKSNSYFPIQYQQPPDRRSQPDILSKLFHTTISKKQPSIEQAKPTINQMQSSLFTNKKMQQSLSPSQQIGLLKTQNNDIQQQIKILKEKLKKLQELERKQRQQQWRDGLPYFIINIPKLRIFYTKLTISEKDYDKIDYSLYSADLNLQKIVLNQLPQSGISSRPPKHICLMLSQLKQVSYPSKKTNNVGQTTTFQINRPKQIQSENIIVYNFKHQKNVQNKSKSKNKKSVFAKFKIDDKVKSDQDTQEVTQTLFVKFQSEELYKQWDLGVYVNFKIMEDLTKGQFKLDNASSMNSSALHDDAFKTKDSQDKKKVNQGTNIQFSQLFQKINKKPINEQQKDDKPQQFNMQYDISIKTPSLEKLNSNFDQNQSARKIKRDNDCSNMIKIRDEHQSPVQSKMEIIEEEPIKKQRTQTSHFGNLSPTLSIEDKIRQADVQKQKQQSAEQIRKQKLLHQFQEQKKRQRMQAMKKTQLELSVKRAKDSLKKGYVMTKYAKSAMNPYDKKVFLSEDGNKLCWEDLKSPGEVKSINVGDIIGINQGVIGKGVEAHLNPKKINRKSSFVVIYLDSKHRKTLELSSKDQFAMEEFCKQLDLYRRSLKEKLM